MTEDARIGEDQRGAHLADDVDRSAQGGDATMTSLFSDEDGQLLRSRWMEIQSAFVDEPQRAVQQADALVSETLQRLTESFGAERSRLEQMWDSGQAVSTEDLRLGLQRYRSFFERLLNM